MSTRFQGSRSTQEAHVPVPKFGYVPSLDGFRGCAVLLVMVYHLGHIFRGGHLGVNAFFALSGFLITSLLLREFLNTGRLSMRHFYARRVLRLYPPLVALIVSVTLYVLFIPSAVYGEQSLRSTFASLFYFANWIPAFSGAEMPLGLYEHTWSLSVEEQFILGLLILWDAGPDAQALGRSWRCPRGMRGVSSRSALALSPDLEGLASTAAATHRPTSY